MNTDQAIKNRKTEKILATKALNIPDNNTNLHNTITQLLDLAAHAPFHHVCNNVHSEKELNSALPWRSYVLDTTNCRKLLEYINVNNIKAGKINNMLAVANALIITTWLPEPMDNKVQNDTSIIYTGNLKNMEHIAAASSAIQNILLGATSRNIPNYWSSGGVLRNDTLFNFLKIPLNEILLGALFLFPEDSQKLNVTIKHGALRNKGKELPTWSKFIEL